MAASPGIPPAPIVPSGRTPDGVITPPHPRRRGVAIDQALWGWMVRYARCADSAPAAIAGQRAGARYRAAGGRGRLRIYLGYAPGAGTTCALLGEGHRRAERGADVVVAHAQTHGRPGPSALLAGLEIIPPATVACLGTTAQEMDTRAVLARRPQLALVDELAHANAPGGPHAARWQDVQDLLAAGIDVISAVSIGHLESLADVAEKITGAVPGPTVPDPAVRAAAEVKLVDLAPEALRERMARGHIWPPAEAEAALRGWFQIANLSLLRELALLWLAAKLASDPHRYRPSGHEDVSAGLPPFADAENAAQLGADIRDTTGRGKDGDGHRPDRARTTTKG